MSVELGRRLLASSAIAPSEIQTALYHHLTTGKPFVRSLLEVGGCSESTLDLEPTRSVPPLDAIVPLPALVEQIPAGLCQKLLVVPIRRDHRTGRVEAVVVDPYDPHIVAELSYHLKCEVRVVWAPLGAVEEALGRIARGDFSTTVITQSVPPPTRPFGVRPPSAPPIPLVRRTSRDLDGKRRRDLPDDSKVEVLGVRDILEQVESDGGATDELGQPILPLTTSKVLRGPIAPAVRSAPRKADKAGRKAGERQTMPPETSRGPFSPKVPVAPFPDIGAVLAALERASTRDEVIGHLISGMATVARRVGVFAVKKRGFCGIACNEDLGDAASFRRIEIPTDAPTVLGIAASKGSYLGQLPLTLPHEPLVRFMNGASEEVAAVLVSVAGRPAVVLFADALGDTAMATERAQELGREASLALSRILTQAKSSRRGGS